MQTFGCRKTFSSRHDLSKIRDTVNQRQQGGLAPAHKTTIRTFSVVFPSSSFFNISYATKKRIPSTRKSTKKRMLNQKTHLTVTYQQNQKAQDYKDQNALWCKQEHKGGKQQQQQQQQQQTADWFLHISADEFISHMNFLLRFFKTEKWHKHKTKTFCTNEETSLCFRRPPQESKCYIFRPSSVTVRSLYILHFPACPCSFTHKDTLPLHQRGDGGMVWRDEEEKKIVFSTTRCRCFPEKESVTKNSAPVGKRPFLIGSLLFCA